MDLEVACRAVAVRRKRIAGCNAGGLDFLIASACVDAGFLVGEEFFEGVIAHFIDDFSWPAKEDVIRSSDDFWNYWDVVEKAFAGFVGVGVGGILIGDGGDVGFSKGGDDRVRTAIELGSDDVGVSSRSDDDVAIFCGEIGEDVGERRAAGAGGFGN